MILILQTIFYFLSIKYKLMQKLRSMPAGEVIKHAIEAKCLFSRFIGHAAATKLNGNKDN